jgi:isopenicillin-N N-acyltransferase like protein
MAISFFTSAETGAAARGREFGAGRSAAVHANADGYFALFAAAGGTSSAVRAWAEQALDRTAAWAPELAEEIAGVAEGAGLETWQVAALNARTEILAALSATGRGECSTAVVTRGPSRHTIQTWDWHEHLHQAPVVWEFETHHTVRTFTENGVLAKIGVNSAGLGIHFNLLRHTSDGSDIGVPVHLIARRILGEATTLSEAVEIARSARTSASTVITVVTAAEAAALEICPDGVGVVWPGADGVLVHTNHFLDPALAEGERLGPEQPDTYARLDHLRARADALAHAADPTARADALLSHGPSAAPVCAHPDPAEPITERWETLATICLDVSASRLLVHQGRLCGVGATTWQCF